MAARSVNVTLHNKSDVALVRTKGHLDHGIWTPNRQPPGRIEAGTTASWASESNGVATGTEGYVDYAVEMAPGSQFGKVHMYWDNPFIGSNSYDQSAPAAYKIFRTAGGPDGSGDDSNVEWDFDDASTAGDGIPDDWKRNGVTLDPGDGSGPQFIDLPAMGADVNRADLFLQIDWMANAGHSHAPSAAALKLVVDAFANSPFIAKNGSTGINLHIDAGPNSIMNYATNKTWGALSRARQLGDVPQLGTSSTDSSGNVTYDWTEFDKIKNGTGGFMKSGRGPIFRYCIFGHQIGTLTNSGVARATPGSDFIVSLGTFTGITDTNVAGTLMHELGHCLGLDHGGGDGVNNKPNYISVMNYLWQFPGVTRGGVANIIDYSNALLNPLQEGSLDETVGLGAAAAGVAISHWVPARGALPGRFVQVADGSQPIDWDGDGLTTNKTASVDTNNDSNLTQLTSFDDWKHIKLKGGSVGAGGAYQPPVTSVSNEITPQQLATILPADVTPPVTTMTLWPVPNGAGWNRTDVQITFKATDDISGVARTESTIDGGAVNAGIGPFTLVNEGTHRIAYRSIDYSQNAEAFKSGDVRIDKTAPEAVIQYDPLEDQIMVFARDGLSGTSPLPVTPSAIIPVEWTDFGSDVAELRTYRLRDYADNETVLKMKVRCSPFAYEASIVSISYDDERHARAEARKHKGHDRDPHEAESFEHERNTLVFERLIGRNATQPLLGVRQIVSIGEGSGRQTTHARYDVLDDLSIIARSAGSICCEGKNPQPELDERDMRGLIILQVTTNNYRLGVSEYRSRENL